MGDTLTREALEEREVEFSWGGGLKVRGNDASINAVTRALHAEPGLLQVAEGWAADRAQILKERDDYRARWEQAVASIQPAINEATAEAARRLDERDKELCAEEERAAAILLERDEALARVDALEDALRAAASNLGAGGYNAEEVDPDVFQRKIIDGAQMLVAPWKEDAERYRRLRVIGAAPSGTVHLADGRVLVATNLDAWLDHTIERGIPPAPSHAVEYGGRFGTAPAPEKPRE